MKTKFTRRDLFNSILGKLQLPVEVDPLFAKYARKQSTGRKYQNANPVANAEFNRVTPVTSGLAPYTGAWTSVEALSFIRRTGFGYKKADLDLLSSLPFSQAVDRVLTIDYTAVTGPINSDSSTPSTTTNFLPYGQEWVNDPVNPATGGIANCDAARVRSLQNWQIGQFCNQDISIKQKMALFWYHFIPIDFDIVRAAGAGLGTNSARISYPYMKLFQDNPVGNFKTLIRTIATEPAMMYYLNNHYNTNVSPDENFAREVMELFTLGKDPLSQYTQTDVEQAARVLTGWRVQPLNTTIVPATLFDATKHDITNKQFSSFFGNMIIANNGAAELDNFIDMIFSKTQVVSEYICRRLYRFFVYYDIDATTEATIITPLAQTFVANNWEIMPVLNQLFKSQHFFDIANRGVYIKSPFDIVIGSMRIFNLNYNVSDATNFQAQYNVWNYFQNQILIGLEQSAGNVPNVSGWPAFYQNPSFYEYWINSNTTQKRFAFLNNIFNGFNITNNGLTTRIQVDPIAFVQQFTTATVQDPNLLVAQCINYLLPIDLSTTQKDAIKLQTLLTGQTSDYYWTTSWNNYLSNTSNATYTNEVKTRLKSLLVTITQLAEFQLM